jgi:hypothetical protein
MLYIFIFSLRGLRLTAKLLLGLTSAMIRGTESRWAREKERERETRKWCDIARDNLFEEGQVTLDFSPV